MSKENSNEIPKSRKNDKRNYYDIRRDCSEISEQEARERIWIVAYPHEFGQRGLQSRRSSRESWEKEIRIRGTCKEGRVKPSNPHVPGLERSRRPRKISEVCAQIETSTSSLQNEFTNPNMPRFWPTFATEEEKSEWWTKATASFRNWWEAEPEFCGMDDGLSPGLDEGIELERFRKERIKQLGNSIVPFIAELIGKQIMEVENE